MINLFYAIKNGNNSEALHIAGMLKELNWKVYLDNKPITDDVNNDFNNVKIELVNPKNQSNIISMLKENGYTQHFSKNYPYYARTNLKGEEIMPLVTVSDFNVTIETKRNGCNLFDLESLIKKIKSIHIERKIKV